MAVQLDALSWDARDPHRLADFWGALLGWDRQGVVVVPDDDTGFSIRFVPTERPKLALNWTHFDLTSTSVDNQQDTVRRALDLGAQHFDVGQLPEERHVVLADPEGNEFCVIPPDNAFLADCGYVGALASDGTRAVGLFWSRALGWPLVWDQDEETAVRAPYGGPKITWGGPPVTPSSERNRIRFDLVTDVGIAVEVERLRSLGAALITSDDIGATLSDPDGNEFCVRSSPTE